MRRLWLLGLAALLLAQGALGQPEIPAAPFPDSIGEPEVVVVADPATKGYDTVAIAPAKTSIYVGSVSLAMPPFRRDATGYASTYTAKVFPYFFQNEKGRLRIEFSAENLAALAKGETVQFSGSAENTDGELRRIEGRATPANASSGKIKVRVFVTKKIELIFNTTYQFAQ